MQTLAVIFGALAAFAFVWAHIMAGHRRKLVRLARDVTHADNSEGLYANQPLRGYARAVLAQIGEH